MDRIIRINSQQSGQFNATNDMINFHLNDPTGVYNLAESYLQLDIDIVPGAGTPGTDAVNSIFPFDVSYTLADGNPVPLTFNNILAIRRSQTRSGQFGIMEDRTRNDTLQLNLLRYTESDSEQDGELFKQLIQPIDYTGQRSNFFIEQEKEGSLRSRYVRQPLNIPLSQLSTLGKMRMCPVGKLGGLNFEFQLMPEKFIITEAKNLGQVPALIGGANDELDDVDNNSGGSQEMGIDIPFTLTRGVFEDTGNTVFLPFYVGMPLSFTATGGTGAGAFNGVDKEIASIELDRANGSLEIFTTTSCGTLADTQTLTGLTCVNATPVDLPSLSWTSAQLVLKKVMSPPPMPSSFTYECWETERFSQAGNTILNHTFNLPADCENVILMLPSAGADVVSTSEKLASYRLSVDNIPVVNRRVSVLDGVRDALHYDLIGRAISKGNMKLHNLGATLRKGVEPNLDDQRNGQNSASRAEDSIIIGCPTMRTMNTKQLEVSLETSDDSATLSQLLVCKQRIKTITM